MQNNFFTRDRFLLLDGGLGTTLQKAGLAPGERPEAFMLKNPGAITDIHKAYIAAGADILYANTFGANPKKLQGTGLSLAEVIETAIGCAKKAAAGTGARVALDVGPLGEMLEPGGTLPFLEALGLFAQVMALGAEAGADLVVIETFTDLYEAKAALLAAKENTALPVMVSMSFEENGRSFAGVPVEAMALTLSSLGADALGINCSLGPAAIMPLAERLCAATDKPVFVKPNAGLPHPATGAYALSDGDFAAQMRPCLDMGVQMVGGCCGTTPATIAALRGVFGGKAPARRKAGEAAQSRLCSATRVVEINGVCPVGERINPTGKKKMRQALAEGNMAYLQTLAVEQEQAGALVLDVNVGAPGVDEVVLLPRAVQAVQAVSELPVQIDSANPEALAAALRVCNGKPVVNSTSGEAEKLAAVLPLCKKYGAAVIGLTLDEAGIPAGPEQRCDIAASIVQAAEKAGIPRQDVWIDCLTLAASAEAGAAQSTLKALALVRQRLGVKTLLGVSNISFGLPARPLVNRTFLAMALGAGLDLPILNPSDAGMMDVVAAFRLLHGEDENAAAFVGRFEAEQAAAPGAEGAQMPLDAAIEKGLKLDAAKAAQALLAEGRDGLGLVEAYLMPALDRVGQGFETGRVFLPQLLAAAGAAQAAFEVVRAAMGQNGGEGPAVVLATVKGDVHDIGKNIVKVLMENYGFHIIDLGRDVAPARVVEAVEASGARLVGLSALMTTTLPAMEETIAALRKAAPGAKVMVGGAVLTPEYAAAIGADHYAKDAQKGVAYARELFDI